MIAGRSPNMTGRARRSRARSSRRLPRCRPGKAAPPARRRRTSSVRAAIRGQAAAAAHYRDALTMIASRFNQDDMHRTRHPIRASCSSRRSAVPHLPGLPTPSTLLLQRGGRGHRRPQTCDRLLRSPRTPGMIGASWDSSGAWSGPSHWSESGLQNGEAVIVGFVYSPHTPPAFHYVPDGTVTSCCVCIRLTFSED